MDERLSMYGVNLFQLKVSELQDRLNLNWWKLDKYPELKEEITEYQKLCNIEQFRKLNSQEFDRKLELLCKFLISIGENAF